MRSFPDLYFTTFELNAKFYGVNVRIHSECGKLWAKKNSECGLFSSDETSI